MASDVSLGSGSVDVTGGQLVVHDGLIDATKGMICQGNLTIDVNGNITTAGTITPKRVVAQDVQTNAFSANQMNLGNVDVSSGITVTPNFAQEPLGPHYTSVSVTPGAITQTTWMNVLNPATLNLPIQIPLQISVGAVEVFATLATLTQQVAALTAQVASLQAKIGGK